MEYLKYDCGKLAEIGCELRDVYNKMARLSEEVSNVARSTDPQLFDGGGLQRQMAASEAAVAGLAARLLALCGSLDSINEIYRRADSDALKNASGAAMVAEAGKSYISGGGPGKNAGAGSRAPADGASAPGNAAVVFPAGAAGRAPGTYTAATISSGRIIVESWLAELILKNKMKDPGKK